MEENKAIDWIRTVVSGIRELKGEEGIKILETCGRECAVSHELPDEGKKIRNEVEDKDDIDLLFNTFKEKIYNNSPRLYKEGKTIVLEYHECGCPLVAAGKIKDPFFCHCTKGYTKERFESLFNRPVRVDLIKSILRGDTICKQAITLAE